MDLEKKYFMFRLTRSFSFALNGLRICVVKGTNFKIHLFCTALAALAGSFFHLSLSEWLIILLCIGLVISMEMLNTAIEQLCDVVHKENHPGIKIIKDIAAGAVLVSAIIAAICGAFIFLPKIISFIQSIS